MVWLQSVLLYVHIVGAIFWFGSGLFLQFFMVPALVSMQFEAQKPIFMALAGRYSKIIGPIGGLTVLFGILRGIAAGVLGNLGSAYAITFLASITDKIRGYGRYDTGGMLVMIGLMVAMRAGY